MLAPGQRWMYTVKSTNRKYLIEVVRVIDKERTECKFLWSSDPSYRCGTVGSFGYMPHNSNDFEGPQIFYSLLEGQERPQ